MFKKKRCFFVYNLNLIFLRPHIIKSFIKWEELLSFVKHEK